MNEKMIILIYILQISDGRRNGFSVAELNDIANEEYRFTI